MATSSYASLALVPAVALCLKYGLSPRDLVQSPLLEEYEHRLLQAGEQIPGHAYQNPLNIAREASMLASSEFVLSELKPDGPWLSLNQAAAQMLPVRPGYKLSLTLPVKAVYATDLSVELRVSSKAANYTPDVILEQKTISLSGGQSDVELEFEALFEEARYVFVCLGRNDLLAVRTSQMRVTGILSVHNKLNKAVATSNTKSPPANLGDRKRFV